MGQSTGRIIRNKFGLLTSEAGAPTDALPEHVVELFNDLAAL